MRRICLFLMVGLSALVGCDDDPPAQRLDAAPRPERDMAVQPPVDAGLPVDATPMPEMDASITEPDAAVARHTLVIEGAADQTLFRGEQRTLSARLILADGSPADGSVKVRLIDAAGQDRTAQGVDGSTIDPHEQQTDAEGRVEFVISAGQSDTTFTVEGSADLAEPVEWAVTVAQDPEGGVAVRVLYPEPKRYPNEAFDAVAVGLTAARCAEVWGTPRANLVMAHGLPPIAPFDGDESTAVGGLLHGEQFAAVALGHNDRNQVIALGCTDDVVVEGGAVTTAEVALVDEAMEYKGTFRVEHELALTEVLRADANDDLQTLGTILDVLRAIGAEAGQRGPLIVGLACDFGNIDEQTCLFLQALAGPALDQIIEDAVPPEVLGVLEILGDLVEVIGRFRVQGEMAFAQSFPNADGLLLGNESRWQGIKFAWRNGCDFDDRERCERTFSLIDDLGLPGRTVVAPFDARVEANDRVAIGSHVMRIEFGQIVLGVVEAWILPEVLGVPGPVTLHDLFEQLIPCADLNAALPPNNPNSGVCEATLVGPIADAVADAIINLGVGLDAFALQGAVTVADLNPDRQVDHLVDGVWDVAFGNAADLVPEAGTFSGCRVGDCPEDQAPPAP